MAATVFFCEDYGASFGLMPRGTTRVTGQTTWNWMNNSDPTQVYSDYPITAGNRSFSKYNFLVFSGSFNMITGLTYQHTGNNITGTHIGISGFISGSGAYVTPATTLPTLFSLDFTPTGVSRNVSVGALGPELSGKGLASTSNPVFSEYIAHQLSTLSTALPGDTGTYFHFFNYVEN